MNKDPQQVSEMNVKMNAEAYELAHTTVYGKTPKEKDLAFASLVKKAIEPLSLCVAGRLKLKDPAFVPDAELKVWEALVALKYDWRQTSFRAWCYRVVYNFAIDNLRKQKKFCSLDTTHLAEPTILPEDSEAIAEKLEQDKQKLNAIRSLLDRASDLPKGKRSGMNYYAAFLLEFRRGLAHLAVPHFRNGGELSNQSVGDWIDGNFPLGQRGNLKIRPTFATLQELWAELVRCSHSEPAFEAENLVRAFENLHAPHVLSVDSWHQIASRARRAVKQFVGEDTWNRELGWLFPAREAAARKSELSVAGNFAGGDSELLTHI